MQFANWLCYGRVWFWYSNLELPGKFLLHVDLGSFFSSINTTSFKLMVVRLWLGDEICGLRVVYLNILFSIVPKSDFMLLIFLEWKFILFVMSSGSGWNNFNLLANSMCFDVRFLQYYSNSNIKYVLLHNLSKKTPCHGASGSLAFTNLHQSYSQTS